MVLDVVEIADLHNGINLAAMFAKMVEDFNIAVKLRGVTADNASSNNTMIDELSELLEEFQGQADRSRCFDHMVNLVAKSLLHQFDVPKGKADEALDKAERALRELIINLDIDNLEGENDQEELADNVEGLEDEQDGLSPEEIRELKESVRPVKLVLMKLQKITLAIICSSTKLLPIWLKIVATFKMLENKMPRDVTMRKPIDVITQDRSTKLRKFELSDEEWQITEQLRDILKIFNDATLYFSCATPSLLMDIINEHLTDHSLDHKYLPCIRTVIGLTKKTLNRYYDKTDQSNVYSIAMVLHPSHKLEYFKNAAGWEPQLRFLRFSLKLRSEWPLGLSKSEQN
ncbi:putative AC9 transposase [Sparassis crispa]|uniref:Putative AC9 transposase n=1 Tax=Sparassis crispa TaxID=139825 RepID=A0A401GW85_9APHY|nr:putative AC9 transposase [Sparassis crispa]GBE86486.1 putative AC9 transposase [Sparassis crispa]